MSKQKIGLIVLGVAVLSMFLGVVMTQGPLAPIKVTTDKVQRGKLSNEVFGVGVVEARRSYSLAPTMTSRLSKVLVDQGDRVKAGQLLAEMDAVDLDDRVTSSQQAAERSRYGIQVAEAQLNEAKSRAKTTNATYERYLELRSRGFISQEMLDGKLHEKNAAAAAEEAATASLASARLERSKVHADANGISKLRAQIRLISPVDGLVTSRLAEPGTTVVAGQTIIQVIDPNSMWIKTRVDQKQIGPIQAGLPALIQLRSQPNIAMSGVINRIDLVGDAIAEERIVNVAFAKPQTGAALGELAEVTVKLPDMDNILSIPSAAVKHSKLNEGVWVMQGGRVEFKSVKTGISTLHGRTQILSGLAEGEEVIVYSQQQLQAHTKVKVVSEIVRSTP
jgi:HlyD family secretion protein